MLSSIIVSLEGGFSFAEEDGGSAASICICSASTGADWLPHSDAGLFFCAFKPVKEEGALDTCEELNSSVTSFWC